ncbi:MAG TPA: BtpA/SgcQ family protein [Opitutaceae bacterium]|nr:BtpA/SgcQ family protein [Opitutaceae bacterium]
MKPRVPSLDLTAKRKLLIGVVHLLPLPGAPRWGGSMDAVINAARADAVAYERGGADAIIVENFGDAPFAKDNVPAETVAAMAAAGSAVRAAVKLPLGFNVLRNDAHAALALCAACGGSFIRVNILSGVMVTDQGVIEGRAFEVLRARRALAPDVKILADVHVTHAAPLAPVSIAQAALDTFERGLADALIVSGAGTGKATDSAKALDVKRACPSVPVLIGSGVTAESAQAFETAADGFIVGSSLKRGGRLSNPVDARRVAALRRALGGPQ